MESIYVIELATAKIKVGRSSDLGGRLRTHAELSDQYGADAVQVWSRGVADSRLAEKRLLHLLRAHPTATRSSGWEWWTNVSFLEVVMLVTSLDLPLPPVETLNDLERRPQFVYEVLTALIRAAGPRKAVFTREAIEAVQENRLQLSSPRELAAVLHQLHIAPANVSMDGRQAKGYLTDHLLSARAALALPSMAEETA